MTTPKFWTRLLEQFCSADYFEELQGDLEETYFQIIDNEGKKAANRYYRKEVILLMRPSVIKKLSGGRFASLSLVRMHWTLSVRNLQRHKVFSTVTIFGFAAAVSISLFLINLLYSGYSLDQQHKNVDRIYRVATIANNNGHINTYASTPFHLKDKLEQEFPEFESLTHINRTLRVEIDRNDYPISLNGVYIDESFFSIFDFPMVRGAQNELFNDLNSVFITEEAAKKAFGDQDPIGQITNDGRIIKGIIQSPKNKSHIPFEVVGNINSLERTHQSWYHRDRNYLYTLMPVQTNKEALSAKLSLLANQINQDFKEAQNIEDFEIQGIQGMIFKNEVYNEIGSSFGREGLLVFSVLTLLLIAMAGFNYTNLSMARALQRTKEIGVRKVVGSRPKQIISQFLIETLLISSIGFLLGFAIYQYYSTQLADLIPFAFLPTTNFQIVILFIAFALLMGLMAGVVPAFYFSKISALSLFRSQSSRRGLSARALRKLLVGLQITISMFSIIFLSLIIDQNSTLRKAPTGINSNGILIVPSAPGLADVQAESFQKIAGVGPITFSSSLPVADFPLSTQILLEKNTDTLETRYIITDEHFHEVFETPIDQGRFFNNFSASYDHVEVVVSKGLLRKIGLNNESALGSILNGINQKYLIVGVMQESISANALSAQDEAFMLLYGDERATGRMIVKLQGDNLNGILNDLESSWGELYPEGYFQATFLDSLINSTYSSMNNAIKIVSFIAGCIILISLLGQLGMALFNAQSRIKEIGIRKVMGASLNKVVRLILKNTLQTILISSIIAIPLAYLIFTVLVAPEMREPLSIGAWQLIKGALFLTIILVSVVISQTWRVANLNPSTSLRNE